MFQRSSALVPLLRACSGAVSKPVRVQSRNLWDLVGASDTRNLIRHMNREMERMERNMFRNFPFSFSMPRLIAIDGDKSPNKSYRVNVDVEDFKPEDIKISLKNNIMRIEGKMDKTSEDGTTRLQQTFVREFPLPENVDVSSLKSFVDNNGVLYIEAALAKEDAPKDVPIQIEEGSEAAKEKK